MTSLNISSDFTIDDIHKIREYNYENTKNMNTEQLAEYYSKSASSVEAEIAARKKHIA